MEIVFLVIAVYSVIGKKTMYQAGRDTWHFLHHPVDAVRRKGSSPSSRQWNRNRARRDFRSGRNRNRSDFRSGRGSAARTVGIVARWVLNAVEDWADESTRAWAERREARRHVRDTTADQRMRERIEKRMARDEAWASARERIAIKLGTPWGKARQAENERIEDEAWAVNDLHDSRAEDDAHHANVMRDMDREQHLEPELDELLADVGAKYRAAQYINNEGGDSALRVIAERVGGDPKPPPEPEPDDGIVDAEIVDTEEEDDGDLADVTYIFQGGHSMSAPTAAEGGLTQTLHYIQNQITALQANIDGLEVTIASLKRHHWGEDYLAPGRAFMEQLTVAKAAAASWHSKMSTANVVQDAYRATGNGAGSRESVIDG